MAEAPSQALFASSRHDIWSSPLSGRYASEISAGSKRAKLTPSRHGNAPAFLTPSSIYDMEEIVAVASRRGERARPRHIRQGD